MPSKTQVLTIAALLLLAPAGAWAQARKAAPADSGVPFGSTRFDDEVQNDVVMGPLRLHLAPQMAVKGAGTNAEVSAAFASQISEAMAAKGLTLMTRAEVAAASKTRGLIMSPLAMADEGEIVFRNKDSEALKRLVGKIVWLGNRESGRISGVIDRLYVSVLPSEIQFAGNSARFKPEILVRGTWHATVNTTFKTNLMDANVYNSETLAAELMTAIRGSAMARTAADLEAIGVRVGAQAHALGAAWAKVAAENSLDGKLPANFLRNEGLDGTWEASLGGGFKTLGQQLRDGVDPRKVVETLTKLQAIVEKNIPVYQKASASTRWPAGIDPAAALEAARVLAVHRPALAGLLAEAVARVKAQ